MRVRRRLVALEALLLASLGTASAGLALGACSSHGARDTGADASVGDGAPDGPALDAPAVDDASDESDGPTADAPTGPPFCELPGSVVWTANGPSVVGGAPDGSAPDLTWMKLPQGFCAHYFGTVLDARQLRFAPGGELFVASPTSLTTGGAYQGAVGGVVVLPDDDHDGVADSNITFVDNIASVQGLLFANGLFYYQDDTTIRSVVYHAGDRAPSAAPRRPP